MSNEWTDSDSREFLHVANVITPPRAEQMNMIASLIALCSSLGSVYL